MYRRTLGDELSARREQKAQVVSCGAAPLPPTHTMHGARLLQSVGQGLLIGAQSLPSLLQRLAKALGKAATSSGVQGALIAVNLLLLSTGAGWGSASQWPGGSSQRQRALEGARHCGGRCFRPAASHL